MRSLVLFNNKGGVGKTTLTFNIACMAARLGTPTLLIDYDPQCNLTAVVLDEPELIEIWEESKAPGRTTASCLDLVRRGKGDVTAPQLKPVADDLWLLPGDLTMSQFEQTLAEGWAQILASDNDRALHQTTSLDRLVAIAAEQVGADLVLIDVGPSLGSLNRAALLACDAVVIPLAPDLFSLQGLRNVGPAMRDWRRNWTRVLDYASADEKTLLPDHQAAPIGYVVQQHLARADRPIMAYQRWASQIPSVFHSHVLGSGSVDPDLDIEQDPYCIALFKHFASLVPLAQAAHKPLFDLKQADGVAGGQIQAVARARSAFEELTREIQNRLSELGH